MPVNQTAFQKELCKHIQRVRKDNNAFTKASKAQKRIMVAKEAIKLCNLGLFDVEEDSGYMVYPGANCSSRLEHNLRYQIFNHATEPHSCQVCALGALMIAKSIYCDVRVECSYPAKHDVRQLLHGLFTATEMAIIESAFESDCNTPMCDDMSDRTIVAAERASDYLHRKSPFNRFMAIMRNIIKNNGKLTLGRRTT